MYFQNNHAVDDEFIDKLRKIDIDWMMASTTASGNQNDVTVAPSEWEIVEFTKEEEEIDMLLNDRFKGKTFDSKGKHEWMREYIKQLKVCIKWFQNGLEDLVKEKDHLQTMLDSSERKCVEAEAAMKLKEEELNSTIIKLENNISSLKQSLANEESQKLDAIDFHNKEKEARMALEKNQDSLKEALLQAKQNALISNEKVKTQTDMSKRLQEYNSKLQNELTCVKGSRDAAVEQKETAVKQLDILRSGLYRLREKSERYLSQLQGLCSIALESACSTQREQVYVLQHQLDAANKKIKELKGKNIMYQ